jgi:hypothetical protein
MTDRFRALLAALGAITLLGASARTLVAQTTPTGACLDQISSDSLRLTLIRLRLHSRDVRDGPIREQLQLVGQEVARALRARIAGNDSTVAAADSLLPWRELRQASGLSLLLTPDSVKVVTTRTDSNRVATLLRSVLDSLARGGPMFVWPETSPVMPVSADVLFELPYVETTRLPVDDTLSTDFPVFVLRYPRVTPVQVAPPGPRVTFPAETKQLGNEGTIVAQFVVEADGNMRRGSFVDVPPADLARYNTEWRMAYDSFVRAVRNGVESARFIPARTGGCPIAMLVTQPFAFELR